MQKMRIGEGFGMTRLNCDSIRVHLDGPEAQRQKLSFRILRLAFGLFLMGILSLAPRAGAQGSGAPDFHDVSNQTQTPIPGAGHDYHHLLNETVNFSNGSVTFKINFPVPQSRGITIPFSWTYTSSGVYPLTMGSVGDHPMWNEGGTSNSGWNLSDGIPSATGSVWSYAPPSNAYQTQVAACNYQAGMTFTDSAGVLHNLYVGAQGTSASGSGIMQTCGTQGTVYPAGDGQVVAIPDPDTATKYLGGTTSPHGGAFVVMDKEGTIYFDDNAGSSGIIPAEDRNGNLISVSYSGDSVAQFATYTDTAGRAGPKVNSYQTFYGSGNNPIYVPTSITVGGLTYTATWDTISSGYSASPETATGIPSQNVSCYNQIPATVAATRIVLTSLGLPNGQSYAFSYDSQYGLLNQITYPDGGWVKYSWQVPADWNAVASWTGYEVMPGVNNTTYGAPYSFGCTARYKTAVLKTRTVSFENSTIAQVQTYSYSTSWDTGGGTWNQKTTTVSTTDQLAALPPSTTKYTYVPYLVPRQPFASTSPDPGIPLESQIDYYDWNGSTPIRTVRKTWLDQFNMSSESTTITATGKIGGAVYTYGNPGTGSMASLKYLIEKDEYDYGTGALSSRTATRKTFYNYTCCASLPDVISSRLHFSYPLVMPPLLTSTVVMDGQNSNNILAVTNYGYDETAPSAVSATSHDDGNYGTTTTARGNLTSITRCSAPAANCTSGPKVTYTYDTTGQPVSMTDACGNGICDDVSGTTHTTTFSFADSPSRGSMGNSNAYLTNITNAIGQARTFKYDYNVGYLTSATDENNHTTSYAYGDVLNRPTEVDFPDGGKTTYSYDDANRNITTSKLLDSSGSAVVSVTQRDGMFHPTLTQLASDSLGADIVHTTYDGEGRVRTVSNPYRGSEGPVTTSYYDALGRKVQVKEQDGTSVLQWCYDGVASALTSNTSVGYCNSSQLGSANTGTWVDSTDEKGNHWQRAYDFFGQLTKVMEPNGVTQTPSMETDYTYTLLNNLFSVNQQGTSGSTPRTRSFQYDALSRLTSAYNPETGTIGYSYDLNGNVSTKTSPLVNATSGSPTQTISYCYDVLNRLTMKLNSSSTSACSSSTAGILISSFAYDTSSQPNAQFTTGRLTDEKSYAGATLVFERQPYRYDAMGRLLNEVQSAFKTATSWTYSSPAYRYDLAGNLIASTDGSTPVQSQNTQYPCALPSSTLSDVQSWTTMSVVNCYDAASRLTNVTSSRGEYPTNLFTIGPSSYDAAGHLLNWTQGPTVSGSPALSVIQAFDPNRLWLTSITATGHK